jgi:hypothetical protein
MKILFVPLLVLVTLSCFSFQESKESICLIPKDYTGSVFIIFDQPDGIVPEIENGRYIYRIPKDGVLRTTVQPNYRIKENDYYYVDEQGNRTKLDYLYPGGSAWKDEPHTFDNVDRASGQIFCMMDEIGSTNKSGKVIHWRQFLVGTAKDAERLALERDKRAADVLKNIN